jgi:translation initiation factor IF-2
VTVHPPLSVKDLAAVMKLKVGQVIASLFMQGMTFTANDVLDDDTLIQLIGNEFGCTVHIDRSEAERIAVTSESIQEEIARAAEGTLVLRAPVVTFMGHVDHGKTSLIDAIRSSNRVAQESGAITQHIGAFRVDTAFGPITILDTPGHEAFSTMRERGAGVTDVVVLVIAGDEGIRQQTLEALAQARAAKVQIIVALNKCDRPNFDVENVYRQMAEQELLPEAWGGTTICVQTSAVTKQGINQLLEMIALQTEVMELRANPAMRARGTVLESEMHKGLGATATILVQNGTLRLGDSLVFDDCWARVKTMRNDLGQNLKEAGPSTPVEITGLSALPEAGSAFVVVANEREAREISEARVEGARVQAHQQKRPSMESLLEVEKHNKILRLVVKADVKGSLEAALNALSKIKSEKVSVEIVASGVGEITESDVILAATSKAIIMGFHTVIEAHAADLVRERGVEVQIHDVIYHLVDATKDLMRNLLDKIQRENELGVAEVRQLFKSSALGVIAGCQVIQGLVRRNSQIRVIRDGEMIWKGSIGSLKRLKEDVKEVAKGFDCGILLSGFSDFKEGDLLQAYEYEYIAQDL